MLQLHRVGFLKLGGRQEKPIKKQLLTLAMKQKRLVFSDESHFFVQGYTGSVVRRSSDEPVRAEHLQQTVKYLSKNVLGFFH
jgi:hypothetical protein